MSTEEHHHGGKVLSLYQDTRGSTAMVMDAGGRLLGQSHAMLIQQRPQPGWVEYDPYEIWHRSWQAIEHACRAAGVARDELLTVGVTNQRGTVLLWERDSGRPIGPAISWRCNRSADLCQELRAAGYEEMIRRRTGSPLDVSAAGPKIRWLLEHTPKLRQRAELGEICCGTVDSWLLWNLTEGAVHATDWTNAAGTLLFNLHTQEWDEDLLEIFEIPRQVLPELRPSGYRYGTLRSGQVPITALCADRQARLFGQACFEPGMSAVSYGRDVVVSMMLGPEALDTEGHLRTVIVPALVGEAPYFALEGYILTSGIVVEWLRDALALIATEADSAMLAQQVSDTGGVYFIPAFEGLGSPYGAKGMRGAVVGLTTATNRAQLVRASLEGVAYRVCDVIEAMNEWSGHAVSRLHVDGGAAANDFLLQFQSDMLCVPIARSRFTHSALAGVAYLAGLQAGLWSSREQVSALWPLDRRFEPKLDERSRQRLYAGWRRAVRALLHLYAETEAAESLEPRTE